MKSINKELYTDCLRIFQKWKMRINELSSETLHDSFDTIYALRESAKLLDELRKTLDRFNDNEQLAAVMTLLHLHKTSDKTEYCSAKASNKSSYSMPKRGTPEYKELGDYLGIPEEVTDKNLIEYRYPEMCEYLTDIDSDGGRVPPGIDYKTKHNKPRITIRKRKEILE